MVEITKVSAKGQVVIPARIREELHLGEGDVIAVSRNNNIVMLRKLSTEEALKEFNRLAELGERYAKAKGVKSEEDIVRIIHERRKKRKEERNKSSS